jgi:DHA2 family multidrug resistance protein
MGYTPVHAGLWMLPNAVAVGITMPIAGRLADRYSPAVLAGLGCVLVGSSLLQFGRLDPMSDWTLLVLPQLVRGAGLALMMAPLMAAALNAVPHHELPMASSFLNVSQNVGGSLGIALLNNFVTNSIHTHAVRLGEGFPMQSQAMDIRLGLRTMLLVFRHEPGLMALPQARVAFAAGTGIARKAEVLGFENGFVFAGLILLAAIPLCLLLKPSAHHARPGEKAEESFDAELMAE